VRTQKPRRVPSESVLFCFTQWKSWYEEDVVGNPSREPKKDGMIDLKRVSWEKSLPARVFMLNGKEYYVEVPAFASWGSSRF
jgi:hypothetical protein